MNIKVKDKTLEDILALIAVRKYALRDAKTLYEQAQLHELNLLESFIKQDFNYGD